MSNKAWLKQVLEDAKAARQNWPAWAKNSNAQTALNSQRVLDSQSYPHTPCTHSEPPTTENVRDGINLK
jgi:hypothetical protein